MIPELHPHYFKLNPHANKTAWLSASDLIISISKTTASDFAYYHPKLASKIKCIHLYSGFSHGARQSKPKEGNPSSLFFLYVGQRGTYKNCSLLLRAFAASQPQKHGYLLLCAGGGAFSKKELEDIARLNITGYVSQLSVTDANLWYLYCKASAVLVPSLSEGFSLPLVEGLSADVPVVCSDIPVHREVAKDYAQLINPTQHDDWADVLRSAEQLTKPSVALGKQQYQERLKYFSRERMVEEHVEAYKSLVG
jgi:glycosyltransferase involved in cell wall biosynthesis